MAVLIEGINRPTEPRKCKFFDIDPLGVRKPFCAIQSVCDGLEFCPLVEVPTPHGRLIDADAILGKIKAIISAHPDEADLYEQDAVIVRDWLRSEPTIIESEGE